jgi:hypothetical protein
VAWTKSIQDYADRDAKCRLPSPAALALFAMLGMGVLLIVGGFLLAVALVNGSSPAP